MDGKLNVHLKGISPRQKKANGNLCICFWWRNGIESDLCYKSNDFSEGTSSLLGRDPRSIVSCSVNYFRTLESCQQSEEKWDVSSTTLPPLLANRTSLWGFPLGKSCTLGGSDQKWSFPLRPRNCKFKMKAWVGVVSPRFEKLPLLCCFSAMHLCMCLWVCPNGLPLEGNRPIEFKTWAKGEHCHLGSSNDYQLVFWPRP